MDPQLPHQCDGRRFWQRQSPPTGANGWTTKESLAAFHRPFQQLYTPGALFHGRPAGRLLRMSAMKKTSLAMVVVVVFVVVGVVVVVIVGVVRE